MYYIQDSDYDLAEQNGISKAVVYSRVWNYGYKIEEAITKPVEKRCKERARFAKMAKSNGISKDLYYNRLKKGMGYEEAATTPKPSKEERIRTMADSKRKYFTKEQCEIAKANGISYGTLISRVRTHKWDVERAITESVHKEFRRKGIKTPS